MSKYDLHSSGYQINAAHVRDLRPQVLHDNGRIKVLPAAFWAKASQNERALFGHHTGIYLFPTIELVERLATIIADRSAIEIGSGNGVLAEALGIPATDSFQQVDPRYAKEFAAHDLTAVPYGPNVEKLSAYDAIRKYRPQVVLACWVTHKWDPAQPWREGNEVGVDEADILDLVEEYLFVGNLGPAVKHSQKPIMSRLHETEKPDWIYSRARDHRREVLIRWPGTKPLEAR